jgi:hypothetical protein
MGYFVAADKLLKSIPPFTPEQTENRYVLPAYDKIAPHMDWLACRLHKSRPCLNLPRLIHQHDRYAFADREGKASFVADQFLPLGIEAQRRFGDGANQDFDQTGIGAAGLGGRFRHQADSVLNFYFNITFGRFDNNHPSKLAFNFHIAP